MLPMLLIWSVQSLIKTAALDPGFHKSKTSLENIHLGKFGDSHSDTQVVMLLRSVSACADVLHGPEPPSYFRSFNSSFVQATGHKISAVGAVASGGFNLVLNCCVLAANRWNTLCSTRDLGVWCSPAILGVKVELQLGLQESPWGDSFVCTISFFV